MSSINTRTYESTPAQTVAFLGLGVMGGPMAGHLAKAGHTVTVYNRTPAKAEAWVAEFGAPGRHAATPREAAAGADIVFSCVGNDDDLRLQIKLNSQRARSTDLAAGTEHFAIV